jgi:hypothetical protein
MNKVLVLKGTCMEKKKMGVFFCIKKGFNQLKQVLIERAFRLLKNKKLKFIEKCRYKLI